jgi:hypothetical protein
LILRLIGTFAAKFWNETAGIASRVDEWKIFKSTIFNRGAEWVMTQPRIWWLLVLSGTEIRIDKCTR